MTKLPKELIDKIILYLDFRQVIFLGDHLIQKKAYESLEFPRDFEINISGDLNVLKLLYYNNIHVKDEYSIFHRVWKYPEVSELTCSINYKYEYSRWYIIFYIAAINGHLEVVKWLSNIHKYDNKFILSSVAKRGHLQLVKWLYNNIGVCKQDITAMYKAARNGHLEVVKWLYHTGSQTTYTIVGSSVYSGNSKLVEWVLKDMDHQDCTNIYPRDKCTEEILSLLKKYPNRECHSASCVHVTDAFIDVVRYGR